MLNLGFFLRFFWEIGPIYLWCQQIHSAKWSFITSAKKVKVFALVCPSIPLLSSIIIIFLTDKVSLKFCTERVSDK